MDQRMAFVATAEAEGANVRALCRAFGISPTTGYKWLGRAAAEGLCEHSRRPHRSPRETPAPVRLGSGDFFGEIALLADRRRTADVVTLGYCQLLVLDARDFRRLLRADPALRRRIDAVARRRLGHASVPAAPTTETRGLRQEGDASRFSNTSLPSPGA